MFAQIITKGSSRYFSGTVANLKRLINLNRLHVRTVADKSRFHSNAEDYRILYLKEKKDHKDTKKELKLEIETRMEAQMLLVQAQKEELKKLYRQTIEEVEDGFPQPYDDDFDSKKVIWDKTKLKAKSGFDAKEERRRQQWLHYLKNPPNDLMRNIVANAAKLEMDVEKLAVGISKAHRLLDDDCHVRLIETNIRIVYPKKYFMKDRDSVVRSLRIVLKEADILQDYIDLCNGVLN
ncbi:uncharacterized protein LOC135838027 isoform X2 [Planococcus citri]|uniref:uncharacterized protein LOC135838027 isoform X2 n=1 Tax=Planococcus citri TaxID=170843 RepID=UPI0031F7BB9C